MNITPLVTIITVVLNGKIPLEKTIQSVKNQTYKNIEFIVIDGKSTDGTMDVITKNNSVISQWVSEKDFGIYDAMNKGIIRSTGEWIIFMNAGDTFYSTNTLSEIFSAKRNSDVLYGHMLADYGSFKKLIYSNPTSSINYDKPYCHQSCIIKRKSIIKFDLDFKYAADYCQYLEMINSKHTFEQLNIIVSIFSIDGVSGFNKKLILEKHQINQKHIQNYGFIESFKYFLINSRNILLSILKSKIGESYFLKLRKISNRLK